MPAAVISSTTVFGTVPLTVASFFGVLKPAIAQATVTTASSPYNIPTTLFSETAALLVYQIVGSAATKGTAYLRIGAAISGSTLTVTQQLADTWNATTNTVVSGAAPLGTTSTWGTNLNINNAINITTVKHPEMQLVFIDQGAAILIIIGWLRPSVKDTDWDENSCPFFFIPDDETLTNFNGAGSTILPFTSVGTQNFLLEGATGYQRIKPRSSAIQAKLGPTILSPTGEGPAGSFSTDFGYGSVGGLTRFASSLNTRTYTVLTTPSTTAGAIILGAGPQSL